MAEDQNRTFHDKFMLRFPEGMRDRIKVASELSGRSMNSEIIQRLMWSLETMADTLRLDLPDSLWNSLMTDASLNQVSNEQRAVQLLQAAFSENPQHTDSLSKIRDLYRSNSDLEEYIERLKATQDTDFLLYYAKAVQLGQLARSIEANSDSIPAEITDAARDIMALHAAEMLILRQRYDEALFKARLNEHSRRLAEEVSQGADDDENSPITLGSEIKDPS